MSINEEGHGERVLLWIEENRKLGRVLSSRVDEEVASRLKFGVKITRDHPY